MKLIRCHIENFGVLSDFDFAFDDGLTIICQGNGFGKSTFAAFIKAMFYGFPRTGARNIVENERKRYDPWQGGKYGGYLEFKIQDTSYRVTRYFGKTAAKDTFSLLDLSSRRLSEVYSEKLGEELFRLDADSFARSTYVPQLSASDVEATTSIRTKLSNLVEDTNDLTADADVSIPNMEELQISEKNIQEQIDNIDEKLRNLRQERDSIRRLVENIPVWEDRMARLKIEEENAEKKCALTEQTMFLLNRAKDNLANSYIGKVERGFKYYSDTLMEKGIGKVMVDNNLHLHIDEKGAAREVGSFSAGMIDCIVLCMRLALVDALFGEEKPFLILDDPFVNLDDKHTKRAREMLDKIAQDHQVIYLVCNSSRQ